MIFVTNKYDLSYYGNIPAQLCYCEYLASASDMYLQGSWSPNLSPYTLGAAVWTVDGNTALEVIDPAYYEFYIARNPFTGNHYFTFRLKAYTAVMCEEKCFLIRIGVTNASGDLVFAAWTERYCIPSCCEHISGVYINQDGYVETVTSTFSGTSAGEPTGACGRPLIRLISTSDCWNAFTGEYFGQPATTIQGTYFPFVKISTMEGVIKQRPREITVERSYNCRIQRVESARQYLLDGYEYFPSWKMDEIESQFSSSRIYVDDFSGIVEYKYYGGTPFRRYDTRECYDVFKLNATLSECITRQIFGCISTCVEGNGAYYFIIPAQYDDGLFYDNNGNVIASYIDGSGSSLVNWFASQGLTVSIVSLSPVPCNYAAILSVTGDVVPPSIYYDEPTFSNQIQGIFLTTTDNICDYIPTSECDAPVIGMITFGDMPCDAPIIGTITYGDVVGTALTFTFDAAWTEITSSFELFNNVVEFDINATTPQFANANNEVVFEGMYIGFIEGAGVPNAPRIVPVPADADFLDGATILVDEFGRFYLTGTMQWAGLPDVEINFTNLIYNIV